MSRDRCAAAAYTVTALLLALTFGCPIEANAAAALSGDIVRPDGLLIASLVTVRDAERGFAWTLQSASSGTFRLENMPAGRYEVTVRSPDLPVQVVPVTEVGEDINITIRLQPGAMTGALTSAAMLPYLPEDESASPQANDDARQLMRFHCIQCHGLEMIVGTAKTPEQWDDTVKVMASRVPPAPEGQMARISRYLARHFGLKDRTTVPMTGSSQFAFEPDAVLVELDLPKADAHPHDIRLGPDGNIWVTDFDVRPDLKHNSIFRIDPKTLKIETIELAVAATGARSITFDQNGAAWINILFGNILAKMDVGSGEVTVFDIPGEKVWPHTLSFGPQGEIWFSGMWADVLGRFEPSSGTFSFRPVPTGHSMLYDVEVDRNGLVWYTGLFAHKLGRFDPHTGEFAEFATPTPLSSTRYLDIGPEGDIWVALFAAGRIGRFNTATETFEEIPLPDPNSSPYDLQVSDTGRIWYTDFTRNSVASLDLKSRRVAEYSIPSSPYARPTELDLGSDDRIWFCENGMGKVGFIDAHAVVNPGVYRVPGTVAH